MNWVIGNGDVSGVHCYINIHTLSEANNRNSVDSTNKRDENVPNLSEMENNILKDGVDVDVLLPESTLHQYVYMECNHEYHYLMMY